MRLAVAFALLAALAPTAHAAAGDEERARGHYEIGLGLYRLGDYRAALKEFAAGYELAHKPGFLLNLGQTYRKLGELREARDMYRQFLAEVPRDEPARPQAQKILAEIEAAIRAEPPPPPQTAKRDLDVARPAEEPPPTPTVADSPTAMTTTTTTTTAPPPPAPSPAASVAHEAPPRASHRGLRIAGVAVGAVGVGLVAAGLGTAVAADHDARDLNALDASGGAFDAAKDRAYTLDHALSIAFFATGAVAAATGVVLLVVGRR